MLSDKWCKIMTDTSISDNSTTNDIEPSDKHETKIEILIDSHQHMTMILERLIHKMETFVEPSIARLLQLESKHSDKISDNLRMNSIILTDLHSMNTSKNSEINLEILENKI